MSNKVDISQKKTDSIRLTRIAIAVLVLVVLIVGGIWYYNSTPQPKLATANQDKTQVVPAPIAQPETDNKIPDSIVKDTAAKIAILQSPSPRVLRKKSIAPPPVQNITPIAADAPPEMFKKESAIAAEPKKEQADFGEMAVMNYAARQKPATENEETADKPVMTQPTGTGRPKTAQPQGGWDAYNKYIEGSSVIPGIKEEIVKVRFAVNGDGAINDIDVTGKVSPDAEQKAIELIKNGPAWFGNINGKPKQFTIKIKFRNK